MFFKTDAERASAQAAKARHDAGEAGSIAATGARNLGAAVLATLAEATAPQDHNKGRKHAQKARAKALKAATHDRQAAAKAVASAAGHGRKAADLGLAAADRRTAKLTQAAQKQAAKASKVAGKKAAKANKRAEKSAGRLAALAGTAAVGTRKRTSHLAEGARERAEHLAERTAPLKASAKEKAGVSAAMLAALAAVARERAADTRHRAVVGLDHGIDAAVPRAQEGVAAVGPRVDHLRDVINEELLPKIQAMLGDVQVNKDRVLSEQEGPAVALTGSAKKRKKKGGLLIAFGLLSAAGAAVAWWLGEQEKSPAKDPWASQAGGADPWASRTPTTAAGSTPDVGTAAGAAGATAAPSAQSFGVSSAGEDAQAGTTAGTTSAGPVASGSGSSSDYPRMLDSEEIDAMATEEPAAAEDQTPGESPTDEITSARQHADKISHDSGGGTDRDDSAARNEAADREHADDSTWSGTDRGDEHDRAGLGTGPDVDPGPGQPPLDRPGGEQRHDGGSPRS